MILADRFESKYQIIYPGDAKKTDITAARELKKYLFKISGAVIPEFRDTRAEKDFEIVLGYTSRGGYTEEEKTELGDEGFIIRTDGDKLYIIGGKRGVLYGVYTFLEEYCDVRFYTRDFERIPEKTTLEIPVIETNKQLPGFAYRNSCWYSQNTAEISVKRKMNGGHCKEGGEFPEELGGSEEYYGGFCHTIAFLAETGDFWHQPCLTDENIYNTVVKNIRKIMTEYPHAKVISITQNDGISGQCKCDKCRAINEKEGSEAGTNIWFVNKIAEELEQEYPEVMFDTFAYNFTRIPPKYIRPRHNVVIRFCTINSCFRHAFNECGETPGYEPTGSSLADYMREWHKISDHLAVWNYNTNFTNSVVVYPNIDAMRKNARFFKETGVESVFEQGCIARPNGEFGELKGYLNAKLLWNPMMSEEEYKAIINEFVTDFYGEAAPFILQFINLSLEASADGHMNVYFDDPTLIGYCKDGKDIADGRHLYIERANEMFDKAESAVTKGFYLANVRRSRLQVMDYTDFSMRHDIDETEDEALKEELRAKIVENNKVRYEYMKRYGVTSNREFNDIEPIGDPDYSKHGLLWEVPKDE